MSTEAAADPTVASGSSSDYYVGDISGTCHSSAGKCTISVHFDPQEVGASKATLKLSVCKVSETSVCSTYSVALTGTGTAPATLSATSIAFGTVPEGLDTARTETVTVDAGYYVSNVAASGNAGFGTANVEPDCSDPSLTAATTCTFSATFTPYETPAVTGDANVTLCEIDGSAVCAVDAIPLTGTGSPGAIDSPTAKAFGTVIIGTTNTVIEKIKVLGGWYVALLSGTGVPFDYSKLSNGCGRTGPVTCTFALTYSATAAVSSSGSLSVYVCSLSGHYCDTLVIRETGTGKAPGTVSPTSLAYGSVLVGSSSSKAVTVTYDSGWEVSSVSFGAAPSNFSTNLSAACNPDNPGTSCTFDATFAPIGLGAIASSMTVTMCTVDQSLCEPLTPIPVTATGVAPATQTPTSLSFSNVTVLASSTKSYTVTPNAGWYVQGVASNLPAPPYSAALESNCAAGPGKPCTVDVTFAPTFGGTQTGYAAVVICNQSTAQCFTMSSVKATGTGVLTATSTALTIDEVRPNLGFADLLTATVAPTVNGGTVEFEAGSAQVCSAPVLESSVASCSWSPTHTGTYLIKAVYSGDAAFKTSTSKTIQVTAVMPPP
jgi:hypothetical protein